MASLSSLLWWWHRQPQHWFPKRGKLQGGLLELQASPCCCSGVFVALFHVWAARAAVWVLDALADFPGGALQRAGATAKGKVSRAEMSLTEHRQAQPCSGGFLQPWTIQGSFSGLCTCSRTWAVLWESSGWESKASQHCSAAATYTCLCRQLILLIVLQKCCMFFSSLQSHSLELR